MIETFLQVNILKKESGLNSHPSLTIFSFLPEPIKLQSRILPVILKVEGRFFLKIDGKKIPFQYMYRLLSLDRAK